MVKRYRTPQVLDVIDRLHRLCKREQIGRAQRYRVEFLCLAFKHDLVNAITRYELWDEGWEGLGERQWDTCFEMGDAEEVIADVIQRARQEGFLEAVQRYCTMPGAFERWLSYADRQACLF